VLFGGGKRVREFILFIGIGPFSILALIGQSGSPFNIRESISAPNFTREEVKELFKTWSETKRKSVAPEVLDNIYEQTQGHCGLVKPFWTLHR